MGIKIALLNEDQLQTLKKIEEEMNVMLVAYQEEEK